MSKIEDLTEQLRRRKAHTFCKKILAITRRKYKCAQNRIIALYDSVGCWHIYIDPEGLVGAFTGCCKWEAMIKALEDKFGTRKREAKND